MALVRRLSPHHHYSPLYTGDRRELQRALDRLSLKRHLVPGPEFKLEGRRSGMHGVLTATTAGYSTFCRCASKRRNRLSFCGRTRSVKGAPRGSNRRASLSAGASAYLPMASERVLYVTHRLRLVPSTPRPAARIPRSARTAIVDSERREVVFGKGQHIGREAGDIRTAATRRPSPNDVVYDRRRDARWRDAETQQHRIASCSLRLGGAGGPVPSAVDVPPSPAPVNSGNETWLTSRGL